MKTLLKSWLVQALALVMATSVAFAQDREPFRQEELDQMLAPVALYPDPLLSQILMASTYPLEVVHASRWSRANPGLKGEEAVRAAGQMDWDPSVKALAAFPQVLAMMDENIGWTERLGEAFLAQQEEVMDAVQGLRRRAEAAGNLRSSEQMQVAHQGEVISIEPPTPEIVYVPYYNPTVVYGPWWYPAYPPIYWAAPPAYYVVHRHGFYWGPGITISAGFFFGHADWHRRRVNVVHTHVTNVTVINNSSARRSPVAWQHNPAHRRGVPVRNDAARQRFEQTRAAVPAASVAPSRSAIVRQRDVEERRNQAPEQRENGRAERRDANAPRAAAPSPSANVRQPGAEERQRAAPEQRENRWVERRDASTQTQRAAPNVNGNRTPDRSVNERATGRSEAARPEARNSQAEPRPRPVQAVRQRVERPEPTRPQARAIEQPRPSAPPAPRAETRTAPRTITGASVARPHPVARAPNQAPRAARNHEPGDRGVRVRRD